MNTRADVERAARKEAHAMLKDSPTSFAFQQWFVERWIKQELAWHERKVTP